MALQNRVSRLEEIQASQAKQRVMYQSNEVTRQWQDNAIQSINERRRLVDAGIIEDTYSPQPRAPLPPDACPTKM